MSKRGHPFLITPLRPNITFCTWQKSIVGRGSKKYKIKRRFYTFFDLKQTQTNRTFVAKNQMMAIHSGKDFPLK